MAASSASEKEPDQEAEAHLRWVLDASGQFPDLPGFDQLAPEQIVSLGGGVDAVTYLVRCPARDVVVKLNTVGLEAEATALRAWKAYTPRVPDVLGLGTVPSAGEHSIKYLILSALKNDRGEIVETARDYLERSSRKRSRAGACAGRRAAPLASGRGPYRLRQLRRFTWQRANLQQLERLPRGFPCLACRFPTTVGHG